jgi:predicted MFS family arabinose efflux permease
VVSEIVAASTLAPLRQPAFRWLWLGMLVSSVGTVMQTVGAQWLLVDVPNAAALVSLVQVVNTLPIMLLALAGGVLADSFDRRWLLFVVQVYFLLVGVVLTVLTVEGRMPPPLLLGFTFVMGAGIALQQPSWGATIPELVPRPQLRAASRLDLVNVNVSRAVGPALAGLVIAHLGVVPVVFALNAFSVVFLAVALLVWRRPKHTAQHTREGFVAALRAGGRYVWHEPIVRRLLLRAMLFVVPAMALWALLPLIASQRLGVGADGYGLLFGAVGVGAIVGALVLGRVQARLVTNGTLVAGALLYAAALMLVVTGPTFLVAMLAMIGAGLAWMAVTSTLQAELQLVLPVWVRARALSIYTLVFMGSNAAGALLWGLTANRLGLQPAMLLAGGAMVAGAAAGLFWRVPNTDHVDVQPAVYWSDARLAVEPEPGAGPVLVVVHYTVTPEQQVPFLDAMGHLRRARLRTGGTRWELYRDGERPNQFVELFTVRSWEEHQRQHAGRLTKSDRVVEEAALSFSSPPAYADHLLPPIVGRER